MRGQIGNLQAGWNALTASKVLKELLDYLHVTRDLLTTHLLDAVVAVVNAENLLAAKDSDADDEDVLAD